MTYRWIYVYRTIQHTHTNNYAQVKIYTYLYKHTYTMMQPRTGGDAYLRDHTGETPLDVAENVAAPRAQTHTSTDTNTTRTCEQVLRDAMGLPSQGEDVLISHILIKHKVCLCVVRREFNARPPS